MGRFGLGRERAEFGMDFDLLDDGLVGFFVLGLEGLLFGQVEGGDLEAVEEQAGAAGVEVVGGDALEDLADGGLDGGAVLGEGQVEGGAAGAAGARVGGGAAGGVVVVAEVLVAERGAAAAVAVGEDVAALEAFGLLWLVLWRGVFHGVSPPGRKCAKYSKEKT